MSVVNDKIVKRAIEALVQKSLKEDYITALVGPRQVGKSTLLNQLLPQEHTLSLTFDSGEVRHRILTQESWLEEQLEKKIKAPLSSPSWKQKVYLLIDEVQKLPESFEILKMLYDKFHSKLKIVISGSSSLLIKKHSAESLSGRIRYFSMYPLTLEEACRLENLKANEESQSEDVLKMISRLFSGQFTEKEGKKIYEEKRFIRSTFATALEGWCRWGLLPGCLKINHEEGRHFYLRDYIDTYLEKDMRATERIGSMTDYRKLVRLMGDRLGELVNYSEIAKQIEIHRGTVKEYLSILDESLLGFRLPAFSESISKQVVKSEKSFLVDNGLAYYFIDLKPLEILRASGHIGHLYENLMVSEFRKYASLFSHPLYFSYWRLSGHHPVEVDLVLYSQGHILPVEIKMTKRLDSRDLKGMNAFFECMKKKNIPYGVVIYQGDFLYDKDKKIFFIPDWFFS